MLVIILIFKQANIINQHFDSEKNNTYKIWQLIYLSIWIEYALKLSNKERV